MEREIGNYYVAIGILGLHRGYIPLCLTKLKQVLDLELQSSGCPKTVAKVYRALEMTCVVCLG